MRMSKVKFFLTIKQVRAVKVRARLDGVSPSAVIRAAVDRHLFPEDER